MPLASLTDLTFGFGSPPLLESVTLQIEAGERIGLLGRNGAGKSTLLRLILGELEPDRGEVKRQEGVGVARLIQEVPEGTGRSIFEQVACGLGAAGSIVAEFRRLHAMSPATRSAADQARLRDVQQQYNELHGWDLLRQVESILTQTSLPADAAFASLSAGMKRRVLLAQSLVGDPQILLLDEPTNHLDLETIDWLESFLSRYAGTLIFVTHDRAFLKRLATRIVEIDRGRLYDWTCDYETFVRRKDAALEAEAQQEALFDKKLAAEEAWIRQGIKARRTRNEGRVRALQKLREQRRARREQVGRARAEVQQAERSGQLVIEARDVQFAWTDRPVVAGLTTTILRGDRVGILGPNGAGKTTLLRLLLGELEPQQGTIRLGTNLQTVSFDQLREQIDETKTLAENVGGGQDALIINGRRKPLIGYLQDFLFPPDRALKPARRLSGGERNRLLLARIFARPSNLLVLDEPTNDLDTETLELLEELLSEYPGTLLLVSHDRAFLNNVVTSTLVFEGDGKVREYAGGYDDWLVQRQARDAPEATSTDSSREGRPARDRPRKLTFREQRELEQLPGRIEALEGEQAELSARMAEPGFYQQDGEAIARATDRLESIRSQLSEAYARWETLEALPQ